MLGRLTRSVLPAAVPPLIDPKGADNRVAEVRGPVRTAFTTTRGHCRPFGPTPRPGVVNFAVFSRHAQQVHLVLFQEGHEEPVAEIPLDPTLNKTGDVWHVFVENLPPELWSMKLPGAPRRTVRTIAAHLHNARGAWVKALGARHGVTVPRAVDGRTVRQAALARALARSSEGIIDLIRLGVDYKF